MDEKLKQLKEQTKIMVLEDLVFKLDSLFQSLIEAKGLPVENFQSLTYLQKTNVICVGGLPISMGCISFLKNKYIDGHDDIVQSNNLRKLYEYWENLDYIKHEVSIVIKGNRIEEFSYKVKFDKDCYKIDKINRIISYDCNDIKSIFDSLFDSFQKSVG